MSFLSQFWFLLVNCWQTDAYVSFFAGYSSWLPGIFAKLTKKPHIVILGGTDCVLLRSINYGNYRKKTLGAFTKWSIRQSTLLLPVDKSLVDSKYNYVEEQFDRQGYTNFCSPVNVPFVPIPIGYDPEKFYCQEAKMPNSFLTVGQMNAANYYRKGVDLIFKLAIAYPDCKFTVVGHTEGMVYPDDVPANVQLKAFVPYDQLRQVYATHEFYLQLSMMEGFPSAPCEAMLCECVPIVSSVAALPEIVGDTGFVLQTKHFDQLKHLVHDALLSDKTTLRKKARQRIIDKYPLTVRLQLIDEIQKLIENRS